jgi:hypothetical protein
MALKYGLGRKERLISSTDFARYQKVVIQMELRLLAR